VTARTGQPPRIPGRFSFHAPSTLYKVPGIVSPLKYALKRLSERHHALRNLVMGLAKLDFERRYPNTRFRPVLLLIPSYLEAANI